MDARRSASQFVPLDALATTLGLPRAWLRAEAEAARIPCLNVNGRRLFDVEAVRRALVQQMKEGSQFLEPNAN